MSLYRCLTFVLYATIIVSLLAYPAGYDVKAAPQSPLAGSALQFNGSSSYVTFGSAAGLTNLGVQVFTIEAWIYRTGAGVTTSTGTGGLANAVPLVTKGRGEGDNSNLDMNYFFGINSTGVLAADFEECNSSMGAPCAAGGSAGLNHPGLGTTVLQDNVWYHVAASYDNRYWRFYVNGVADGTTDIGAVRYPRWDSIQHAGIATAMTSTGATGGFFQGVIDEVRVWNVVRSQAEIQANMLGELTSGTGLISRWGLNEAAGATAGNSIAGRPNGTLTGSPTWTADGTPFAFSGALRLNNSTPHNTYVTFGDAAALKLSQFTVETWFRRDGAGTTVSTGTGGIGSAIPLVTKGAGQAEGSNVDENFLLVIDDATDTIAADFEEGAGGASPGLNHPVYGITPIVNGVWYHAAVTYDGATWNLYLNGVLERTLAVGQPVRSDSIQHAALGTTLSSTGTPGGYLDGTLDETRIWNYARSISEIQSAINTQITTAQSGLVARWGLNEGAGTVVNGSAGTAVNGTITNTRYLWVAPAPFNISFMGPAAPVNLLAAANSNTVASLSWVDNASNETLFRIQRRTPPAAFANLATVAANTTTYTDSPLAAGTQYCYQVRAENAIGNSAWTNEACLTTPVTAGNAINFDGTNDYVTFGQTLNAASFTLEAWVRRAAGGATMTTGTAGFDGSGGRPNGIYPVVTKGMGEGETPSNINMNYFMGITATGVLGADFEDAATGGNHPAWGTTQIPIGEWHHIAVTYGAGCWALYVDGNPEPLDALATPCPAATPESGSLQHAALGVGLGSTGQLPGTPGYFSGVIDEARIWNVVRSPAEILGAANSELSSGTGLIGRWGMIEGSGITIASSVGSTPGTLTNGPIWVPGAPFGLANQAPGQPGTRTPGNTSTGVTVPAPLSLTSSDLNGDQVTVTFYARPVQVSLPEFTVVALPDTQYYSSTTAYNHFFSDQTSWIVNNQVAQNIAFVTHLGDIVDGGDSATAQWTVAANAMAILDTAPANVPFSLGLGNHDQGSVSGDPAASTTSYNSYFGIPRFSGKSYYGGHYGTNNDNHWEWFDIGSGTNALKFIIITLEAVYDSYSFEAGVLSWADNLLKQHPDRRGIVTFHTLFTTTSALSTRGTQLLNELRDNPNLFLMLGGHVPGVGRRTETGDDGHAIYCVLADYQSGYTNGGNGYMRLMRFVPSANQVQVTTFSPTGGAGGTATSLTDSANQFILDYNLGTAGFTQIGTPQMVASGSPASVSYAGLLPLTQYEWYATISDGRRTITTGTWSFTTDLSPTAVEIQSIAAAPSGSQVKLTWTTVNEETLFGFNVLRSESMDGPRAKVNEHLIVAQRPGQFAGGMYEFTDAVTPGVRYYYWLEVNETGDANSWAFGPATFNVTRIPLVVMIP